LATRISEQHQGISKDILTSGIKRLVADGNSWRVAASDDVDHALDSFLVTAIDLPQDAF
jgi:hypothetical protein